MNSMNSTWLPVCLNLVCHRMVTVADNVDAVDHFFAYFCLDTEKTVILAYLVNVWFIHFLPWLRHVSCIDRIWHTECMLFVLFTRLGLPVRLDFSQTRHGLPKICSARPTHDAVTFCHYWSRSGLKSFWTSGRIRPLKSFQSTNRFHAFRSFSNI